MIAKKIPRRDPAGRSPAEQIGALITYILAGGQDGADKLVVAGGVNFITSSNAGRLIEMQALASCCPKSPMPVSHWVLSWRSDERPTIAHIEQAARMFVDEIGFGGHQFIWGVHGNTSNLHCHIAINRVSSESEKVVKPNKGSDRLAAQRAIAKIEGAFDWRPEDGALYTVNEAGQVVPRDDVHTGNDILTVDEVTRKARSGDHKEDGPTAISETADEPDGAALAAMAPRISYPARGSEIRSGKKSAQRVAQDGGVAATIARARSWAELHVMLAYSHDAAYERAGGGANIIMGGRSVKSSSVDRAITPRALEKRLGPFQPPAGDIALAIETAVNAPRATEFIDPLASIFDADRAAYTQAKRGARAAMEEDIDVRRNELRERQETDWAEFRATSWAGRGAACNVMRAGIAKHHRAQRADLQAEITAWRDKLRDDFPDWPDFQTWKSQRAISYQSGKLAENCKILREVERLAENGVQFAANGEIRGKYRRESEPASDLIQVRIDAALAAASEGPQRGWSAEEIRARLVLIIQDMSSTSYGQFVEDGWRPAVTQETAPGRLRATILADRAGVEREDEAARELARRLTDLYADLPPTPTEAAFPVARLVEKVRRVCTKAAEEIAAIAASLVHGRRADDADARPDEEIERQAQRDGPEF